MKKIIIILSLLALAASCTRHEPVSKPGQEGEPRSIMLKAMTKAGGSASDAEQTPVFLFLFEDGKNNFGTTVVEPYFMSLPKGRIDDYKTTPYNTGYPYPGSLTLYANGYSPSLLVVSDGDFTSLSIPDDLLGRLDITSTTGFVQGSTADPFDSKTLVFSHILSKVNFYARLGEIPAERYFRAVKVTVNGNGRLTENIKWNNATRAWQAGETISNDILWTGSDENENQMDPNEIDPRTIGSVYIHPGQESITFDIELEMSETVTFDSPKTIHSTVTVYFESSPGNNIILKAGEEYDINITILYDSFVIKGNKALWQDGGKIPLPFYPN